MPDTATVFVELKSVLLPYAEKLSVTTDTAHEFRMNTRHIQKNRKPLFFAAVQVKKNYVSFHLMPVYVRPELLKGVSPKLKARMQGKSCFNFTKVDAELFGELAKLTEAGFASYQEQRFV
jgi:hypothetical protein